MADYDVALSYASENRRYVRNVYNELRRRKVRTFYDRDPDCQVDIMGNDIHYMFEHVFGGGATIVVLFLSDAYLKKDWPLFELESLKRGAPFQRFLGRECLPVPVFFGKPEEIEVPEWLLRKGGIRRDKKMKGSHLAGLISKKLKCITELPKEAVLLKFATRDFSGVCEVIQKMLKKRARLTESQQDWLLYNQACACSRLAEEHERYGRKCNRFLNDSLASLREWFALVKNKKSTTHSFKEAIEYLQSDDDLLYLRTHRLQEVSVLIARPPNQSATGTSPCCIHPGNAVVASRGNVAARDLRVDDELLSFEVEGGRVCRKVFAKVRYICLCTKESYVVINNSLWCSVTQRVYEQQTGWTDANTLSVGMSVMDQNGNFVAVSSLSTRVERNDVVHIEVDPPHTFIAGGLLCHNRC